MQHDLDEFFHDGDDERLEDVGGIDFLVGDFEYLKYMTLAKVSVETIRYVKHQTNQKKPFALWISPRKEYKISSAVKDIIGLKHLKRVKLINGFTYKDFMKFLYSLFTLEEKCLPCLLVIDHIREYQTIHRYNLQTNNLIIQNQHFYSLILATLKNLRAFTKNKMKIIVTFDYTIDKIDRGFPIDKILYYSTYEVFIYYARRIFEISEDMVDIGWKTARKEISNLSRKRGYYYPNWSNNRLEDWKVKEKILKELIGDYKHPRILKLFNYPIRQVDFDITKPMGPDSIEYIDINFALLYQPSLMEYPPEIILKLVFRKFLPGVRIYI